MLRRHTRISCAVKKGVQILLRDAHGRIQGSYQNGKFDTKPVAGKDLTLSIDVKLQALAERMLQGKIGSVVAIEPSTGEVLALVSSPTYDPRTLMGRMKQNASCLVTKCVETTFESCYPWDSILGFYIQDNAGIDISH